MEKKKLAWWKKCCIALVVIVAMFCALLEGGRLYLRLPVSDYYRASDKAFVIPGLSDDFVPQGISFDKGSDTFLLTGYQKDHTASPIYRVRRSGGEADGRVLLTAPDGGDLALHTGGLSVLGDYIYVAGDDGCCVYVYSRQDVLSAADGARVNCLGTFDTYFGQHDGLRVAFTAVHDDKLIVGEFYRDPNYLTPDSHKFTSPAGEQLQAVALVYEPAQGDGAAFGLNPVPVEAYALPDLVQGMAFHDGKVWLSTSYAVAFSGVYAYDMAGLKAFGQLPVQGGESIPLYALDSAARTASFKLPPMSEEIEFVDGKLYTMCESASNQYIFGKLTGGQWCYATDMESLDGQTEE